MIIRKWKGWYIAQEIECYKGKKKGDYQYGVYDDNL